MNICIGNIKFSLVPDSNTPLDFFSCYFLGRFLGGGGRWVGLFYKTNISTMSIKQNHWFADLATTRVNISQDIIIYKPIFFSFWIINTFIVINVYFNSFYHMPFSSSTFVIFINTYMKLRIARWHYFLHLNYF